MEVNEFSDTQMINNSRDFSDHHNGWWLDNFTSGTQADACTVMVETSYMM